MSDDTHDDERTATNLFGATPLAETNHSLDDVRRVAVYDDGSVVRGEPFEALPVDADDDGVVAVGWEHKLTDGAPRPSPSHD